MADDPVFDPNKTLGSGLGKLTRSELLKLVKKLCEISVTQCGENGFRGGFRPGNIAISDGKVTVGPADKAGEDGWTKDELEYMAPEVFWNGKKTSRADVYSIGLILYVGLNCGNVPFVPMADYKPTPEVRANALRKRMNGEKIPLHKIEDTSLASIVGKAIEFDTDKRYASALELLNALRIYSGEKPVQEIKKEAAPVPKKAPEAKPVEPKPEPKKEAAPKPASEAKPVQPKPEVKVEEPVKLRQNHPIVPKYKIKARRTRCITLIIIALILCGTAYVRECTDFKFSDIHFDFELKDILPTPKPEPTPEPTAEPTAEPSAKPEPTPEPTPTPEQKTKPICELIVEDVSWDKAEQKCMEMGGHLISIASEEDYLAVCDLLNGTDAKYVWIGCYRNNADILTWTDGTKTEYYKWADGEPSLVDAYDGANEDYLMLVRQSDGTWLYNDNRMDPLADYSQYYSGRIAYICQHG